MHFPGLQEAQLADVKWQQAVFEVLLSYHPFWLRLGLETIVGQLLPSDAGKKSDPCPPILPNLGCVLVYRNRFVLR